MKKTNKTFKRFAAITSASLLAACAVMPAVTSALDFNLTDPKVEVNEQLVSTLPEGAVIQETVSAYQVFTLTKVDDLYNVTGWGAGVNSADLIDEITENTTDFQIGEDGAKVNAFAGITSTATDSAQKVGAVLPKLSEEQQEAFAKAVMNNLNAATATGKYENNMVSFTTIENGYYIMSCEVKKDGETEYTSESLGMLTVVDNNLEEGVIGNIGENGQAKVGLPTVQKKVYEDQAANAAAEDDLAKYETDALWNDVADYDIGDAVPFKLYGTLPADLAKYDTYYYKFTDTLGTEFDEPTELTINIGTTDTYTAKYDSSTWNIYGKNNNILENSGISVTYTSGTDDNGFTVEFDNIKALGATKDTIVTVSYDAVLNETADIGNPGQVNKVNLTYSNNPNNAGKGEVGVTPDDSVKVHTYAIELEKKFFNAANEQLTPDELENGVYESARFSLTKVVDNGDGTTTDVPLYFQKLTGDSDYDYILVDASEMTPEEKEAASLLSLTEIAGKDGKIDERADNNLVIRIKGLDEGTYKLKEEKVPEGFNKAPEQTIAIDAGTVNDQSWNGTTEDVTLKSFSWTVSDGTNSSTVNQGVDADGNAYKDKDGNPISITAEALATMENRQGTSLPGTGGIGTTIFYLGGGAMAAIGGIYLVSKRRMRKSEE